MKMYFALENSSSLYAFTCLNMTFLHLHCLHLHTVLNYIYNMNYFVHYLSVHVYILCLH